MHFTQNRVAAYFVQPSLCAHLSPWHKSKLLKRKQALHDWFETASGVLETASSASSLGSFGDAVMCSCNMVRLASQIVSALACGAWASQYWKSMEKLLRTCTCLEQTHTRWPFKIAVRRKVSHRADASLILEKSPHSCHFPLTHLLDELCLFQLQPVLSHRCCMSDQFTGAPLWLR